jgi:hypothetical protein
MEMIDREADGSDSLEVRSHKVMREDMLILINIGLHDAAFHSRRHWIWTGLVSLGKVERSLPQETHPDVFGIPGYNNLECCSSSLQQSARYAEIDSECGFSSCSRQWCIIPHCS